MAIAFDKLINFMVRVEMLAETEGIKIKDTGGQTMFSILDERGYVSEWFAVYFKASTEN